MGRMGQPKHIMRWQSGQRIQDQAEDLQEKIEDFRMVSEPYKYRMSGCNFHCAGILSQYR